MVFATPQHISGVHHRRLVFGHTASDDGIIPQPMAAGEYVSVSSQSDTEQADLAREKRELSEDPEFEKEELAGSMSNAA